MVSAKLVTPNTADQALLIKPTLSKTSTKNLIKQQKNQTKNSKITQNK